MRIGLDGRYGLLRTRRGIGVYVYQLLRMWATEKPQGFEFVVFVDSRADPSIMAELARPYLAIKMLRANPFAVWEQIAWPIAARQSRCDALHGTANIAPLIWRGPFVLTLHDVIEWHRARDFPSTLTVRHQLSRAYRMGTVAANVKRATGIITVSEHARRDIASTLYPDRRDHPPIAVIPLGGDSPKAPVDPSILERYHLTPNGYAMAFGAADPRKNVGLLLSIWTSPRRPRIPLVLVGFEPKELRRLSRRYGHHPSITLLGFEPDERVRALMRHSTVFLYPSFYEGFGLPVIEALAAGVPVLVSKGTAAEEIADGAAWALDPYNPEEWSLAVDSLAANVQVRRDTQLKGRNIADQYTWERTAMNTIQAYRKFLG